MALIVVVLVEGDGAKEVSVTMEELKLPLDNERRGKMLEIN